MLVTQYSQHTSSPLRNNSLDFMSSSRVVRGNRRAVYKHLQCLFLPRGHFSLGKYFKPSRSQMGNLWSKGPLPILRGTPTPQPHQLFLSPSREHFDGWWGEVMATRIKRRISSNSSCLQRQDVLNSHPKNGGNEAGYSCSARKQVEITLTAWAGMDLYALVWDMSSSPCPRARGFSTYRGACGMEPCFFQVSPLPWPK